MMMGEGTGELVLDDLVDFRSPAEIVNGVFGPRGEDEVCLMPGRIVVCGGEANEGVGWRRGVF